MMGAKSPLSDRARERMLARLCQQGADAALEYACAVISAHPGNRALLRALFGALPPDLEERLNTALWNLAAKREARQAEREAVIDRAFQEQGERERQCASALADGLEQARRIGQAAIHVAALNTDIRRACGATKMEIAQAIALRREAIRSTRVKELLGCTDAELKRWSEDGRLPVLFRRRMPISAAGKTLDVRHWLCSTVSDAIANVDAWREEDRSARRSRRGRAAK